MKSSHTSENFGLVLTLSCFLLAAPAFIYSSSLVHNAVVADNGSNRPTKLTQQIITNTYNRNKSFEERSISANRKHNRSSQQQRKQLVMTRIRCMIATVLWERGRYYSSTGFFDKDHIRTPPWTQYERAKFSGSGTLMYSVPGWKGRW